MIAECVLNKVQAPGLRADLEARLGYSLIVGIAWEEHHPVLAKGDRPPVAVGRDVPDGQCRHDISVPRRKSCMIRANCRCLPSAFDAVDGSSTGPPRFGGGLRAGGSGGRVHARVVTLSHSAREPSVGFCGIKFVGAEANAPRSMPQYSSASMIVMTRWVTEGSAGSGGVHGHVAIEISDGIKERIASRLERLEAGYGNASHAAPGSWPPSAQPPPLSAYSAPSGAS
jgi:hypothetical protein